MRETYDAGRADGGPASRPTALAADVPVGEAGPAELGWPSRVVLGAPDVALAVFGDDCCELSTGGARYELRVSGPDRDRLRQVVEDVLPRLSRLSPLGSLISEPELDLVLPLLPQLAQMGVVFLPRLAAGSLATAADLRLYTYLARRTPLVDPAFEQVRRRRVILAGPVGLAESWAGVLREQGLTVATTESWRDLEPSTATSPEEILVLVLLGRDRPTLEEANLACHRAQRSWVPVTIEQSLVRIGPWVDYRQTACPTCSPPDPGQEVGAGWAPLGEQVATSWSALQPGATHWAAGLLGTLALRALIPLGAESPWGRLTVLDIERMEQRSSLVWKDPQCPVCSRPPHLVQEWVELQP
jgi:bacteriocin biosynthesis cyclodehydratase domain-containing protein